MVGFLNYILSLLRILNAEAPDDCAFLDVGLFHVAEHGRCG